MKKILAILWLFTHAFTTRKCENATLEKMRWKLQMATIFHPVFLSLASQLPDNKSWK